MVEVAVVITVATVLILLALTAVAAWIVPKSLNVEEDEENPPKRPSDGLPPAQDGRLSCHTVAGGSLYSRPKPS